MLRAVTHALVVPTVIALLACAPVLAQEPAHDHDHDHDHAHDHGQPNPGQAQPTAPTGPKRLQPVPSEGFQILDGLWKQRLDTLRAVTLPALLDRIEADGAVANFAIAGGREKGVRRGPPEADDQVYMGIEAIGYTLLRGRDAALEARADAWIENIAAAQRDDGYLNTYAQVEGKAHWSDLGAGHELASAGRLIDAAIAYQRATKKSRLLDVARKLADHVDRTFGPGKKTDPSAHPGIEASLANLFAATGEARYMVLAKFLVDARGVTNGRAGWKELAQDHVALREQKTMVGDPVRATSLYSGAAEVARLSRDDTLIAPLSTIFADVVANQMQITGALCVPGGKADGSVMSSSQLAAGAYDCPTCASIGLAEWAHRMFLLTGDAPYADVVDTVIHNTVSSALSLKGDAAFDSLALSSTGEPARRAISEGTACAANLVRFVARIPDLIFAVGGNTLYVAQYVPCKFDVGIAGVPVNIKMTSDWPFLGRVNFDVNPAGTLTFGIKLRRPAWCKGVVYKHDLKEQEHESAFPGTEAGWEAYERKYEPNDGAAAHFLSPVRREYAAANASLGQGRVAICRGPLVYAAEGHDNRGSARAVVFPTSGKLVPWDMPDSKLGSIRVFKGKGGLAERAADGTNTARNSEVVFVPYFMWGNRGPSDMVVWIAETPAVATPK